MPAHKYSQLFLESASKEPIIVVIINRSDEGAIKL